MRRSGVVGVALLAVLPVAVPVHAAAKYLIEMGWDEPNASFLVAHHAEMETAPFEGVVFHLTYHLKNGAERNLAWDAWGNNVYRDSTFTSAAESIRAIPFKRLKRNFLRMNVTPGDVDWFDDYSNVLSNVEMIGRLARVAGAKGVFLDTEQYQTHLFDYRAGRQADKHSYAEYVTKARQRGGEVMRAFERGYPGLTVFLSNGWTLPYIRMVGDKVSIEKQPYNLLIPFLNGMLAAASDSARIVDGCEGSFFLRKVSDVDDYRHHYLVGGHAYSGDSLKFDRIVGLALSMWLDHDSTHHPWDQKVFTNNHRDPETTRAVLRRMIEDSDEYTWLYSQQPRWWSPEGGRQNLPQAYVKAVLDARAGLLPP